MSEFKMIELAKKLYAFTEEDVNSVRQYYQKSQEEIDRDCEIIKEWMKQQNHFPDDYDKRRIERVLLRNKFRVERTKQKIESYYTIKGQNKSFLKKMDPSNEAMQTNFKAVYNLPLPKLMNGTDRIHVYRYGNNDHLFCLENDVLLLQALLETEILHDYAVGVRFIVDIENITMTHVAGMELNTIIKSIKLYQECQSGRILSFEFINVNSTINVIMNLFKLALSEKLYNKIRVHNDLESLKKCIPVECLPKEYGGNLGSIYDIHEDVKELFTKNGDFFMQRVEMVADESKRVGDVKKNELFGVDGTFKKINLD